MYKFITNSLNDIKDFFGVQYAYAKFVITDSISSDTVSDKEVNDIISNVVDSKDQMFEKEVSLDSHDYERMSCEEIDVVRARNKEIADSKVERRIMVRRLIIDRRGGKGDRVIGRRRKDRRKVKCFRRVKHTSYDRYINIHE